MRFFDIFAQALVTPTLDTSLSPMDSKVRTPKKWSSTPVKSGHLSTQVHFPELRTLVFRHHWCRTPLYFGGASKVDIYQLCSEPDLYDQIGEMNKKLHP